MINMHPNITNKLKNYEETLKNSYIEFRTIDFNLSSIINCHKRQSN